MSRVFSRGASRTYVGALIARAVRCTGGSYSVFEWVGGAEGGRCGDLSAKTRLEKLHSRPGRNGRNGLFQGTIEGTE